eukprot:1241837-Prymnesium_polylepis.1
MPFGPPPSVTAPSPPPSPAGRRPTPATAAAVSPQRTPAKTGPAAQNWSAERWSSGAPSAIHMAPRPL